MGLHPFFINTPFRHRYLAEALEYMRSHDDVWFTTSDEIAAWYADHCYDQAMAALEARGAAA
jgi:hypothetical protein